MKTLFRVLVLGVFLSMLGVAAFAQDDPESLEALFNAYKIERKKPCGQREKALEVGKKIIDKYGSDELNKAIIEYVTKDTAKIRQEDPVCKTNEAYNTSFKAKDWPKFMTVSKEIIAREGDSELGFDVLLTAASVGFDRSATDKNDSYANDALNYAKQALQKLGSGKTSKTFGTFDPFNTKENATSWMNYIIGYFTDKAASTDPAKRKEALSYFFKATQIGTEKKSDVSIYTRIGDYYFDQAATLDEEYRKLRAANNNEENDEAKAKLALARGYADRSIDAFGRGRQVAGKNPKVVEGITKKLGDLYKFRFNLAPDAKTPEMENYVSGFLAKPMPDPSSDVTPVVEEVKPTTTSTTPSPTPTNVKVSTTPAKQPMSSTTTNSTTEASTATTTKTPVKKPVTKKKGTR